jgi:8-oxo-dGTP pyrophosphatase MutT (NUDIX family)
VESREQTIRRETKEEVGLQLKNLVFWKDEFDNKMTPVQTWRTYFFIGGGEGKIKLDKGEISEIILINRRNFEELDIAFNHREILEEFFGLR